MYRRVKEENLGRASARITIDGGTICTNCLSAMDVAQKRGSTDGIRIQQKQFRLSFFE